MDDPNVTTAINNNHPAELTKLTNRFIGEALSRIAKFGDFLAYIKQPNMESDLKISIFTMDGLNRKYLRFPIKSKLVEINIRRLAVIQMGLWSVVSSAAFEIITTSIFSLGKKLDGKQIDENEFWLWLECLTKCILCTTKCVYEKYATDLENENPMCQLLLLEASIRHNFVPFIQFGMNPSGRDRGIDNAEAPTDTKKSPFLWEDMTNKFVSCCLNKTSQASFLARSDDNKTLMFWGSTGVLTTIQSTFTMESFIKNYSSIAGETSILPKMAKATHVYLHKKLQPLKTELMKALKKEMDSPYPYNNIWKLLDYNVLLHSQDFDKHKLELKMIHKLYIQFCDQFAKQKLAFPNNVIDELCKYMKIMVSFSGLLIHDFLNTNYENLSDHKNVLAHVLLHCIKGCYSGGKITWLKFFKNLIPQSAFIGNATSTQLRRLNLFCYQCTNNMSIQVPATKDLFQFYFEQKHFSDTKLMNDQAILDYDLNVDLTYTKASIEKKKLKGKSDKRIRDESHSSSDKKMRDGSEDSMTTKSHETPTKSNKRHCPAPNITTSKSQAKNKPTLKGAPTTVVASSYYDFMKPTVLVRPSSSSQVVSKQGSKQKVVRTSPPVRKPVQQSSPKISFKSDAGKGDNIMCDDSVERLVFLSLLTDAFNKNVVTDKPFFDKDTPIKSNKNIKAIPSKLLRPSSSSQGSKQGSQQKVVCTQSPVIKPVPSSPKKSQNKKQLLSPSPTRTSSRLNKQRLSSCEK